MYQSSASYKQYSAESAHQHIKQPNARRLLQSRFDNMSVAKASSVACGDFIARTPEVTMAEVPFIDMNRGVLMLLRDTPID